MEPASATDVCDGFFKSKNITVHGNATIIKQTGPKRVYSVEQRKALELMTATVVKTIKPFASYMFWRTDHY